MPREVRSKEADPRVVYADIIDLPHHQSETHPRMSLYARAAQFSSYKALSGYEDMVAEEARVTDRQIELSDGQLDRLGQKLELISEAVGAGETPLIIFTVFLPDEQKAGGKYIEVTDRVRKVDTVNRKIVLMSVRDVSGVRETLDFDRILDIRGDLVDDLDDYPD
ncbi:MAG: hypothetical protein IJQ02_08520 [Oscillospiraceae bacterium]|nr:hypothetical protein [Oscillospiraceae bacterium]